MRANPRIYIEDDLAMGMDIALSPEHTHYLHKVLRLSLHDEILLFNGRDGEYLCHLDEFSKKKCVASTTSQTRPQDAQTGLTLYFAPIKGDRTQTIVEKATELGATKIVPIITERTIVRKLNLQKLRLTAIEAAEQCERLNVPQIDDEISFDYFIANLPQETTIFFADERADCPTPNKLEIKPAGNLALLVGPEGGFSAKEREKLLACENICAISLGKQILRADTACFAGLSLIQAKWGDW